MIFFRIPNANALIVVTRENFSKGSKVRHEKQMVKFSWSS